MKISDVKVYVLKPAANGQKQSTKSWITETVIANPMSRYPEYFKARSSWFGMLERTIVAIETDEGIVGYGETNGGTASAEIIKRHLSRFLIGQNPFHYEKLWDILFRVTLPYGRKGVPIMAISAVDLAIWDLISKARNEPLYQTLGGPVRDKLQAYVTGNDFEQTKGMGFIGQKLAMPYGPAHGREGMLQNVELIRQAREHLGSEVEIMLDCYMAWDVEYTMRMAEWIEPYRVKWIEEPLPPDDYEGYAKLNANVRHTAIATGEHEYTRYGYQQLLDARGAEILQPDVCWVGGLTEMKKICAMASAKHLTVIPHSGGLKPWAVHLSFAEPSIPMAEYAFRYGFDQNNEDPVWEGIIVPEKGWFTLPSSPGAGISMKPSALDVLHEVT
jgi:L-rhamnonate dehydratase